MEMHGEQRIEAPQQVVWDALNDADVLRQCIPGADDLVKVSATEFTATIMAKVGPVKAKFGGKIVLSDINEPDSYTLAAEGKGAAGFCKGAARVSLAADGNATVLTYTATATVGGKLAQVGARLIDGVAKKMAGDFFAAFTEIVAAGPRPASDDAQPDSETAVAAGAASGVKRTNVWAWVIGAIVLVVLALYFLGGSDG